MKIVNIKNFTISIDDSEEDYTDEQIFEWVNHALGGRGNQIKASNPLSDFPLNEAEVNWSEIKIKNI